MGYFRRAVIVLLGFCMPIEYARLFTVAGFVVTPPKIATAALLGFALIQAVLAARPRRAFPTMHLWMALLALSTVASVAVSYGEGVPVSALARVSTTAFFLFAFYFTLQSVLRDWQDVEWLLRSLVVGCAFVGVTGLLGFGFQSFTAQGDRIGGLGGNSNMLAFNSVLGLGAASFFALQSRGIVSRGWWFGLIGVLVVAILSTLSRSAVLAMLAMGGLWVVRFRRFDTLKYALPAIGLAAAIAVFAPDAFIARIETLQPDEIRADASAQQRMRAFPLAIRAALANPVLGVGVLNFLPWAHEVTSGTYPGNVVHNMFLYVAAEQGLLGLIAELGVVIVAWRCLSRTWNACSRSQDPAIRRMGMAAAFFQISFIGMLVIGQFQPTHHHKGLWMVYALAPVIQAMAIQRLRGVQGRGSVPRRGDSFWSPEPQPGTSAGQA